MKTKVKLILFLALISSFSCSDTNSKLENELTKEIGVKPTILDGTQNIKYVWQYISIENSKSIKNTIDRVLNVLPIVDSGLSSYQKGGKPTLFQYIEWETPNIKVVLSYDYKNDNEMNVAVVVTNK